MWADPEQRRQVLATLARSERITNMQCYWKTRAGELRLGLFSSEVIEIGQARYSLFVWQDITDLKRSEDALRQFNSELESIVEQRTRELTSANLELTALNEEMIAMNEMLEFTNGQLSKEIEGRICIEAELAATNEDLQSTLAQLQKTQFQMIQSEKMAALGGLVAGIAHEINTPLGNCITVASHLHLEFNQLAQDYCNEQKPHPWLQEYIDDGQEAFTALEMNLARTGELVRSFRDVAISQIQEERQRFYIAEYLQQISLTLQPALRKTRLQWRTECPDDLCWNSYPGVLAQIVTHFVINSITHAYTADEAGILHCRFAEEGDNIVIEYQDDGSGMSPEVQKKIFDPFFTTNRGVGSGLGLYIVYNLVTQKLNGTITCVSQAGTGSKFTLWLPQNLK